MKNALKLGGIYGIISTIIGLGYPMIMGLESMFNWKIMLGSMVVGLIIFIVLGRKMIRPSEGDNTLYYGEALKYLFVAAIVGNTISSVSSVAMYNGNEKIEEAFEKYTLETQEATLKMAMNLAGASEEEMAVEMEELHERIESGEVPLATFPFSWAALPMTILSSIFAALILALISAIFVKKT
ncbi:MAG: DUF4199 family protein [Saprospiraceae bacterium]